MRVAEFANEKDKVAYQEAAERELLASTGERWWVDVVPGRFGWFVRAMRLRRNPGCNRPRARRLQVIDRSAAPRLGIAFLVLTEWYKARNLGA